MPYRLGSKRWHRASGGVVVVGLVLIAFGRVVGFDYVNWDDPQYAWSTLVTQWGAEPWRARMLTPQIGYPVPLPIALYAANHALFGHEPASLHALSLVLHALNAALVWALARRLFRGAGLPLLTACLWALHPIVAEAVGWITALKEVSLTSGILLVAHAALGSTRPWIRWILGIVGGLVAFASKPTAVVLGPLLLVAAATVARSGDARTRRALLASGAVCTVLGVAYAALVFGMHEDYGGHADVAPASRMAVVWVLQLRHYVAPLNLGPAYAIGGAPVGTLILAACSSLLVALLTARAWRAAPVLAFGLGWFLVAYLPVSSLIPLGRGAGDSHMYLPTIGAALAVGAAVRWWLDRREPRRMRPWVIAGVGVVAVLALGSFVQVGIWKNGVSLWRHGHAIRPEQGFPLLKLGQALSLHGRAEDAVYRFQQIDPYLGRGLPFPPEYPLAHEQLGQLDRAEALFVRGLRTPARSSDTIRARAEQRALVMAYAAFLRRHDRTPAPGLPEDVAEALRARLSSKGAARAPPGSGTARSLSRRRRASP